jgi:hypothetical protein
MNDAMQKTGDGEHSGGDRGAPKRLLVREIGGEILILDTVADQIHQLNASASLVWRMHAAGKGLFEISAALANEFDITENVAERDASEALQKFGALKLAEQV